MINPEREPLCGIVEADETRRSSRFAPKTTRSSFRRVATGLVRCWSPARSKSTPASRGARLKVIEGFGRDQIHAFVHGAVAPQTQVVTDDWLPCIPGLRHRRPRPANFAASAS